MANTLKTHSADVVRISIIFAIQEGFFRGNGSIRWSVGLCMTVNVEYIMLLLDVLELCIFFKETGFKSNI